MTHLKPAVPVDPQAKPVKVRNLFKIFIYPPTLRISKSKGGLPQALRLSKLERKGRQESHRQQVGDGVGGVLIGGNLEALPYTFKCSNGKHPNHET